MNHKNMKNLDTVEILKVLGNPVRKAIVTSLASRHESLKFSDLMQASGLDPSFDTGHFGCHLSELMKSIDRFGFWALGFGGKTIRTHKKVKFIQFILKNACTP